MPTPAYHYNLLGCNYSNKSYSIISRALNIDAQLNSAVPILYAVILVL